MRRSAPGRWDGKPAYDVDGPSHQRLRGFERAEGGMRRQCHIIHSRQRMIHLERLGMKDIEPGVADVAACQRREEGGFVDQRRARGIDEDYPPFGAGKAPGVEKSPRLVVKREVEGN